MVPATVGREVLVYSGVEAALMAAGVASFLGALAGAMTLGGADPLSVFSGTKPPWSARLYIGMFLLVSHAVTAGALVEVPKIGSCLAAALGLGWLGAGAAGLVLLAKAERALARRALAVAFQGGVGACLVWPLWAYLEIIRAHSRAFAGSA